jgi:hypothetical protein
MLETPVDLGQVEADLEEIVRRFPFVAKALGSWFILSANMSREDPAGIKSRDRFYLFDAKGSLLRRVNLVSWWNPFTWLNRIIKKTLMEALEECRQAQYVVRLRRDGCIRRNYPLSQTIPQPAYRLTIIELLG